MSKITTDKNILLVLGPVIHPEYKNLTEKFCGLVCTELPATTDADTMVLYLCGDISKYTGPIIDRVYVIRDMSHNYDANHKMVAVGAVPIVINGVGVYFREFFESDAHYFHDISQEHVFQKLTESTKSGVAFRNGIYLTDVKVKNTVDEDPPRSAEGPITEFNLLRCSSNLSGPTEAFRDTDKRIIDMLNQRCPHVFENVSKFNHVLAQIYNNTHAPPLGSTFFNIFAMLINYLWLFLFGRQFYKSVTRKAKISAHSDKTKDMPENGLIAFCTFYDHASLLDKGLTPGQDDMFDLRHKNISALTRLQFKLKKGAAEDDPSLKKEFSVTLYPNSVFVIPLSTNRLYTHEIKPSVLDHALLPTRMGYVVRCSKTKAVYSDRTWMVSSGQSVELKKGTSEDIANLRKLYLAENCTTDVIDYGDIYFSMNSGDYKKPTP